MATKPKVKTGTGVLSLVFTLAVILVGYAIYLTQSNQALSVQASALAIHWYQLKPRWVLEIISQGGVLGTLAAVLLSMFQTTMYAAIAFGATYIVGVLLGWDKVAVAGKAAVNEDQPAANHAFINGSTLLIMLPEYPGPNGQMLGGSVDNNPYLQEFYRINKAQLSTPSAPQTPYQRLYIAIFAMLKEHADIPASVGTHHADANLFDHSLAVKDKVKEFFRTRNIDEPLASIAGLAHDMDKVLAYKRKGDTWVKNVNATHHSTYSAYIVATQPEFAELPEEDRNTLTLALRYYHDPDCLPLGATARTERLIQALRVSDGYSIREEKKSAIDSLSAEQLSAMDAGLLKTIASLNINGYLNNGSHAQGWTNPALEVLLMPMSMIIEALGRHVSSDLNRKLQLDHETRTFAHPSVRLISERLFKMDLTLKSYKNMESEAGVFDLKIGHTRFRAAVLIDKIELEKVLPGMCEKWGASQFRLRVTGATDDILEMPLANNPEVEQS